VVDIINSDLREVVKKANLKLWQVAEVYGLSDANFSRKLRKEFTESEKKKVLEIVDYLKSRGV
jgi:predicted XRE-type DNA-binding protein